MKEINRIPAVYKEDLQKLLESINVLESVNKGDRICRVCSKVITLDNLQLLIPRQANTFEFICNSPVCIEEYNRKKEIKK